jgi:hypothetical protein
MALKGTVERIEVESAQVYLAAGPAQGRLVAHVRTDDGKVVRMPVSDLMRDD